MLMFRKATSLFLVLVLFPFAYEAEAGPAATVLSEDDVVALALNARCGTDFRYYEKGVSCEAYTIGESVFLYVPGFGNIPIPGCNYSCLTRVKGLLGEEGRGLFTYRPVDEESLFRITLLDGNLVVAEKGLIFDTSNINAGFLKPCCPPDEDGFGILKAEARGLELFSGMNEPVRDYECEWGEYFVILPADLMNYLRVQMSKEDSFLFKTVKSRFSASGK